METSFWGKWRKINTDGCIFIKSYLQCELELCYSSALVRVQPTYLPMNVFVCPTVCFISLRGLLSLNYIVTDWRTSGLCGLSVSACPWHNEQAGSTLWFNAESLRSSSLIKGWMTVAGSESTGRCSRFGFCTDKHFIVLNSLCLPPDYSSSCQ